MGIFLGFAVLLLYHVVIHEQNANHLTVNVFHPSPIGCFHRLHKVLNSIMLRSFNTFSTYVPITDKPGSWFLLAKCLENTCERVSF